VANSRSGQTHKTQKDRAAQPEPTLNPGYIALRNAFYLTIFTSSPFPCDAWVVEIQQAECPPANPVALMRRIAPSPLTGGSDRLGRAGLEAARFRGTGTCEIDVPPQAQHALILIFRSPEQLDVRFEG
jgi:hypothetical protein